MLGPKGIVTASPPQDKLREAYKQARKLEYAAMAYMSVTLTGYTKERMGAGGGVQGCLVGAFVCVERLVSSPLGPNAAAALAFFCCCM